MPDFYSSYDYIIVGAGTAGCVLASRLSADPKTRVLLLEAGGDDRKFWIQTPLGYGKTINDPSVNWMLNSAPDQGLNARSNYLPRGKVLGGSSSINAMVYTRGIAQDFEDWKAQGNIGWGWSEMRAVFDKMETRLNPRYRKGKGPVVVTDNSDQFHPMKHAVEQAAKTLGWESGVDFNGDDPIGIGPYHFTLKGGKRWSASDAYLRPVLKRNNLRVVTGARVMRVMFKGRVAVGVEFEQSGITLQASAKGRVILCAGALHTPQILQLSGIGDGNHLRALGIATIANNPNVGAHLADHLCLSYHFDAAIKTLNPVFGTMLGRAKMGAKYLLSKRGPMAMSVNQMGGLVRSSPRAKNPDFQLYINPISFDRAEVGAKVKAYPDAQSGITIAFNSCRPKSRGEVLITSPDYRIPPHIDFKFLSHENDVSDILKGAKIVSKFLKTKPAQSIIARHRNLDLASATGDEIIEDFRNRAGTVYHHCGTAKMASPAKGGVIDAGLNVYGVKGLSVVDASAFPNITSMNINAPTLAFAERAAEIILRADL